ncbi:uncharacterized protein LOC131009788 [Salvia miltiorrhiza]|uniref:uncharacterized protein LOC131009788 n=1 Tax=Salvia miltiorrhiza TaxID=226208 RepID=UPI0025AC73BC|nr:uncharacterized protein LOC131009788 [Salvia miltiorrhiza]
MLGSLDCMHWAWKNYPTACKTHTLAATRGNRPSSSKSSHLWIWHAFFGTPASNNDINVLNSSKLFNDMMFTCIILHNMIIEDEGEHATQWEEEVVNEASSTAAASRPCAGVPPDFRTFVARQASLKDAEMHARLALDLKECIWSRFSLIEP